jgi:hypothetical protein
MKPLRTTASIVLVCAAPFLGGSLLYLGALGLTEARAARRRVVVPSASASLWDALTQSFASAPTLAVGRTHPAGALLPDGSVLIAGGAALLAGALDTVPAFTSEVVRVGHPSSGTAALVQNAERCIALALPDGRAMLIADGEAPSITRANGSWERGAPYLQRPGQWGTFASALLPDGRVLLVLPAQGRAETWDPATATWKEAARPALGVDQPELLALEDGRMLLVGATEADTRLQVWTPGASSWQPVGERSGRAVSHRAVQLRGGEVLVLREVLNDWRGTVRDAALWDPGTGRLSTVDSPRRACRGAPLPPCPMVSRSTSASLFRRSGAHARRSGPRSPRRRRLSAITSPCASTTRAFSSRGETDRA